ncbi:MAG: GAF domain-containing protein, partial [Candidatus Rokubacteria bacterium]|nr:GAF domain-containing protein [Candidatus Rokubacteria bacterium]
MMRPTSEPPTRLRIGLVGGGRGGLALLDLLLDWPEAEVTIVIDPRPEAPALVKATALGIATAADHLKVFDHAVDLVLEVTGRPAVLTGLLGAKPGHVEVIGAGSLRFFWNLLQDRVKAARRLAVQLDMAGALSAAADPKRQIALAVQKLAQACGVDRCAFFAVDETSGVVTPVTAQFATGKADDRLRAAFKGLRGLTLKDLPFLTEILGRRRPLEIEDPALSPLTPRGWVEIFGIRSMLVVPTLRKDRVVGVCVLDYCREPRRFSQEQITLALALAGQVALAYDNSRLYARAEDRAEKLAALSTVTRLMTSVHERDRVFQAIAEAATTLLGATTARVWVDDPAHRVLRTRGIFSIDPKIDTLMVDVQAIPYGQGVLGRIFTSRKPEYILDIAHDPRWLNPRLASEGGLKSYAGIPLLAGDRALGVLSILFRDQRQFTGEDEEYMRLLADQAAIALENVQLYEGLEERAARLRTLGRLSRIVSSSLDMHQVLTGIARASAEIMHAPFASFWLVDEATRTLRIGAVSDEQTWADFPVSTLPFDRALVADQVV